MITKRDFILHGSYFCYKYNLARYSDDAPISPEGDKPSEGKETSVKNAEKKMIDETSVKNAEKKMIAEDEELKSVEKQLDTEKELTKEAEEQEKQIAKETENFKKEEEKKVKDVKAEDKKALEKDKQKVTFFVYLFVCNLSILFSNCNY